MTDDRLSDLITGVRALLLDFDGPVCSIFAGLPAPSIADHLRAVITGEGVEIPDDVAALDDPLKVLRRTAKFAPHLVELVEPAFMAKELEAAGSARLTPGAAEAVQAASNAGWPIVIVSNNSEPAIDAVLQRAGLRAQMTGIVGRPIGQPEQMKPHPWPVLRACDLAGVQPRAAVLVGDSDFDMQAAANAGIKAIGLVDGPGKALILGEAGANVLVGDMYQLAGAIAESA